jgi:hypothetical protein
MVDNTEKLEKIQSNFRVKFLKLKNAKDILLALFKKKLEEKKIDDIKRNILNTDYE